jgi:hypothetical protein
MKIRTCSLIAAVVLTCSLTLAQVDTTVRGTYLEDGDHWTKMFLANAAGSHASGIAKSAFTYGIAKAKVVLVFRGATAPVLAHDARPTFRIVGSSETALRDIVIVRLKQKKDEREIQTANVGVFSGVNYQYPKEDTIATESKETKDGLEVRPAADLKNGEYILFTQTATAMPTGYGGYDFSVAAPKPDK